MARGICQSLGVEAGWGGRGGQDETGAGWLRRDVPLVFFYMSTRDLFCFVSGFVVVVSFLQSLTEASAACVAAISSLASVLRRAAGVSRPLHAMQKQAEGPGGIGHLCGVTSEKAGWVSTADCSQLKASN